MDVNVKKRILVVEDDAPIADTIIYALKTEGFEPVWCTTCREAREHLTTLSLDLVVLDIMLPDGNGFELCREIRRQSRLPIIFLTSRAEEVDRIVGLEIGADDYMVKPFSPRELTARIRAILRRFRIDPESDKTVTPPDNFPFTVEEHKQIIRYHGQPVELSRYEFRILTILIKKPGWVFTRSQLMDLAWEEPMSSFDRTIDTHIKNIRAALKTIFPDIDPIVTHRGTGYSLRDHW